MCPNSIHSSIFLFFFKQKTAYEMRISDGVHTCALPICRNLVFLSNEVRQASVAAILAAFALFATIPARSTAAFAATATAIATAAFTARTTTAARVTRFAGRPRIFQFLTGFLVDTAHRQADLAPICHFEDLALPFNWKTVCM